MHAQECFACTTILCIHENLLHPRELCASDKICTANYIWLLITRLWLIFVALLSPGGPNWLYVFKHSKQKIYVLFVEISAPLGYARARIRFHSNLGSSLGSPLFWDGGIWQQRGYFLHRAQGRHSSSPNWFETNAARCWSWFFPSAAASLQELIDAVDSEFGAADAGNGCPETRSARSWRLAVNHQKRQKLKLKYIKVH